MTLTDFFQALEEVLDMDLLAAALSLLSLSFPCLPLSMSLSPSFSLVRSVSGFLSPLAPHLSLTRYLPGFRRAG